MSLETTLIEPQPSLKSIDMIEGSFDSDCFVTKDPELIYNARKMTADHYLQRGFISAEQIGEDGTVKRELDPYHNYSDYYILLEPSTKDIVATCRKINYDVAKGIDSFPVLKHRDQLDSETVQAILSVGLDSVVEISALVKNPSLDRDNTATLKLYRKVLQDSWKKKTHGKAEIFVMACNPKLYEGFQNLFGAQIKRMGSDLDYPGQKAIPSTVDTLNGPISLIERAADTNDPNSASFKSVLEYLFEGARGDLLHPEIVKALHKNGMTEILTKLEIPIKQELIKMTEGKSLKGIVERLTQTKAKAVAAIGLMAYSGARAFAVAKGVSPNSAVDWRIFLGIELGTIPQYVLGMSTLARATLKVEKYSTAQRARAATYAGTALLAPYAYIAAEGQGMPAQTWGAVAAVGLLSATPAIRKIKKGIKFDVPTESSTNL